MQASAKNHIIYNWLAKKIAKAHPNIRRVLSQCQLCCSWVSSKLEKLALAPTTSYLQMDVRGAAAQLVEC